MTLLAENLVEFRGDPTSVCVGKCEGMWRGARWHFEGMAVGRECTFWGKNEEINSVQERKFGGGKTCGNLEGREDQFNVKNEVMSNEGKFTGEKLEVLSGGENEYFEGKMM